VGLNSSQDRRSCREIARPPQCCPTGRLVTVVTELLRLQQTGVTGSGFEEMSDTLTAKYGCVIRRGFYQSYVGAADVGDTARKTQAHCCPGFSNACVWSLITLINLGRLVARGKCTETKWRRHSFAPRTRPSTTSPCTYQQIHNIITVYNTTVSLCNLNRYMFRHFHVIRQFTTSTLLSYTRSSTCS
jgi:hypothetical protein